MTTSAQARRSQRLGEQLEELALSTLRGEGCLVERIATPVRVIGGRRVQTAKVFGDLVGLNQLGKGLLVECKNRGRKPRPSDFRPHQKATLIDWHRRGGVALVAYLDAGRLWLVPAVSILGESAP